MVQTHVFTLAPWCVFGAEVVQNIFSQTPRGLFWLLTQWTSMPKWGHILKTGDEWCCILMLKNTAYWKCPWRCVWTRLFIVSYLDRQLEKILKAKVWMHSMPSIHCMILGGSRKTIIMKESVAFFIAQNWWSCILQCELFHDDHDLLVMKDWLRFYFSESVRNPQTLSTDWPIKMQHKMT